MLTRNILVPLFFISFLILGLRLTPDYGISADEAVQRKHGMVAFDYVGEKLGLGIDKFHPQDNYEDYFGRWHGVLYSMACLGVEQLLGVGEDAGEHYLIRHYAVFLLFWLGAIFFYRLLLVRFKDWRIALAGTLCLVLSPRIFANAFYNPKDLVILPCYIIAGFTAIRFIEMKTVKFALLHGLACGVLINTRIVGMVVPVVTVGLVLLDLLQNRNKNGVLRRYLYSFPAFVTSTAAFTILFWPYLWEKPLRRFLEMFDVLAVYNKWAGDVFMFGRFYQWNEIPWYYIPAWILVTTPIVYLLFFLPGAFHAVRHTIRNMRHLQFFRDEIELVDLTALLLFAGPVAAIIVMNSVVYNGWRHLYFIYPYLLVLAVAGFVKVCRILRGRNKLIYAKTLLGVTGLYLLYLAAWMVWNHPHQNVYFNAFAGTDLTRRFDMDYWGLSYKQGYEELYRRLGNEQVTIIGPNFSAFDNYRYLEKEIADKVTYVWKLSQADYFITNIRRESEFLKYEQGVFPYVNKYFSIDVGGDEIMVVYDLTGEE